MYCATLALSIAEGFVGYYINVSSLYQYINYYIVSSVALILFVSTKSYLDTFESKQNVTATM